MTFGEKLRALRQSRKLTQQDLADILGLSVRTIKNYEGGDSLPKKRQVYHVLADYFQVSLDYLLMEGEGVFLGDPKTLRGQGAKEVLLDLARALFSSRDLTEEDKDRLMRDLQEAYWEAKED
ncbi:MAG: helix-turn-helix transcriptional regulator [Tissierellia bacterium]|nr:helix-turn-helix transcriptional regulator [Tissierellia bacterium]